MATVVFADLVGSTAIFERLGDETAGRFVTQLTSALSKTFEDHHGRVVKLLGDGWTAVTKDGSLAAHFEHTVAVSEDGPLILTARTVSAGVVAAAR